MAIRARGSVVINGRSPAGIPRVPLGPGQNPEGSTQPPGMYGQSAQSFVGKASSSQGGVDSIVESAAANLPTDAQIFTNRTRANQ